MRFRTRRTMPDGLPCGPLNTIADVAGLNVGHATLVQDGPAILRTGVTALRIDGVIDSPVAAGCHVFNGYGKSMGLVQIEELGTMESSVFFTNTLSIGAVQQGVVKLALRAKPDTRSFNAVVMECNDSFLNDIAALAVAPEMAVAAHDGAAREFAQGAVGAGTGMVCFGFKGGIGSSSRKLAIEGREFSFGAMVLSNFGRREDLRLPGVETAFTGGPGIEKGSLIMVLATDLPLMPHQLKRVARHMSLAIGILGAPGYHGSGDIALAFSTTARLGTGNVLQQREFVANDGPAMSAVFRAATWATVEAILDSMFMSPAVKGLRGEVPSLAEALAERETASR